MTLGAQDVQAAGIADLFGVCLDLSLDLVQDCVQAASYSSGVVTGSRPFLRSAMSAMMSGLPPSTTSVPRPAMLVATVTAPERPGLGDDGRFLLVETWRVRTLWATPRLVNCLDRYSERSTLVVTDQDGLAVLVALDDVVDHRVELGFLGLVDEVAVVDSDHRTVGRDRDHTERVSLVKLGQLPSRRYPSCPTTCRTDGSSSAG